MGRSRACCLAVGFGLGFGASIAMGSQSERDQKRVEWFVLKQLAEQATHADRSAWRGAYDRRHKATIRKPPWILARAAAKQLNPH